MKAMGAVVMVVLLVGCMPEFSGSKPSPVMNAGSDASGLSPGMTTEDVIRLVGKPNNTLPLIEGYEVWRYKDDHAVIMEDGRVFNVGVMTDDDYERTMNEIANAYKVIRRTVQ